jgi:hypothetical protein
MGTMALDRPTAEVKDSVARRTALLHLHKSLYADFSAESVPMVSHHSGKNSD